MAVAKMKVLSIIGALRDLDEVANSCGKLGVFQPDNVFSFYSNTSEFTPVESENFYIKMIRILQASINSFGAKLDLVDSKEYKMSRSSMEYAIKEFTSDIEIFVSKKNKLVSTAEKIKAEIKTLSHFIGLNENLKNILDCNFILPRFGKISTKNLAFLPEKAGQNEIIFISISEEKDFKWGLYFADIENREEIDRVFSRFSFEETQLNPYDATPKEQIEKFKSDLSKINEKIKEIDRKLKNYWSERKSDVTRVYSKLLELSTYCDIKTFAAKHNNRFILVGWVPAEDVEKLTKRLKNIPSVECSIEDGSKLHKNSPPIQMKNKKIYKPFEFFVDMYGLPSYGEPDPTPFVAITYMILFGIMFADLGQGIVISIIGYVMWKLKKMQLGLALIPCGIFSAIFGIFFGEVFGFSHALDPMYKNLFGLHEKPFEIMDPKNTMNILFVAIAIGVFLVMCAMIANIYSLIKAKKYGKMLFSQNGVCGLIFYGALIFIVLDLLVLKTGIANAAFIVIFLGLPLIGIFFQEILSNLVMRKKDWKPESWGEYILEAFFEVFEVLLGYISNTMSFLRVGAFVIAHASLMLAVFTLAELFSNPIAYISIVIIGNVIVIGLEALVTGIQVLRLEFYEMFSRFYIGEGRPFEPVKVTEQIAY